MDITYVTYCRTTDGMIITVSRRSDIDKHEAGQWQHKIQRVCPDDGEQPRTVTARVSFTHRPPQPGTTTIDSPVPLDYATAVLSSRQRPPVRTQAKSPSSPSTGTAPRLPPTARPERSQSPRSSPSCARVALTRSTSTGGGGGLGRHRAHPESCHRPQRSTRHQWHECNVLRCNPVAERITRRILRFLQLRGRCRVPSRGNFAPAIAIPKTLRGRQYLANPATGIMCLSPFLLQPIHAMPADVRRAGSGASHRRLILGVRAYSTNLTPSLSRRQHFPGFRRFAHPSWKAPSPSGCVRYRVPKDSLATVHRRRKGGTLNQRNK